MPGRRSCINFSTGQYSCKSILIKFHYLLLLILIVSKLNYTGTYAHCGNNCFSYGGLSPTGTIFFDQYSTLINIQPGISNELATKNRTKEGRWEKDTTVTPMSVNYLISNNSRYGAVSEASNVHHNNNYFFFILLISNQA